MVILTAKSTDAPFREVKRRVDDTNTTYKSLCKGKYTRMIWLSSKATPISSSRKSYESPSSSLVFLRQQISNRIRRHRLEIRQRKNASTVFLVDG